MKEFLKFLIYFLQFLLGLHSEEEAEPSNNDNEDNNSEIEEVENAGTTTHEIVVLIDNGHASTTPGKRSPKLPDGSRFFEYEFNRDIARRLSEKLTAIGVEHYLLVPEVNEDIGLSKRAQRANEICNKVGKAKCLFVSIHANACGNGEEWKTARGWSCYTSKGETASDKYAEIFMKCASDMLVPLGQKIRKYTSEKYSWEENFTVLVKTVCPAVLTENLFYDNKKDLEFLQTEDGREAIAQLHVNAILEIEKNLTV